VAFERITIDPDVTGGLPCIRGVRMPVATVVGMVADGIPVAEILDDFPDPRPRTSPRRCATRPPPSVNASCRFLLTRRAANQRPAERARVILGNLDVVANDLDTEQSSSSAKRPSHSSPAHGHKT
jgi:hypothetical protein